MKDNITTYKWPDIQHDFECSTGWILWVATARPEKSTRSLWRRYIVSCLFYCQAVSNTLNSPFKLALRMVSASAGDNDSKSYKSLLTPARLHERAVWESHVWLVEQVLALRVTDVTTRLNLNSCQERGLSPYYTLYPLRQYSHPRLESDHLMSGHSSQFQLSSWTLRSLNCKQFNLLIQVRLVWSLVALESQFHRHLDLAAVDIFLFGPCCTRSLPISYITTIYCNTSDR